MSCVAVAAQASPAASVSPATLFTERRSISSGQLYFSPLPHRYILQQHNVWGSVHWQTLSSGTAGSRKLNAEWCCLRAPLSLSRPEVVGKPEQSTKLCRTPRPKRSALSARNKKHSVPLSSFNFLKRLLSAR